MTNSGSRLFKRIRSTILVGLGTLLVGCASMESSPCSNDAWFRIGYRDGLQGCLASRITFHRKICYPHNVLPDEDLYERGRRKGILGYCTPENGFQVGLHGIGYDSQCPPELETAFLDALERGRELYYLELTGKNDESALESFRAELQAVDRKLADRQAALVREGIADSSRPHQISDELDQLVERKKMLLVQVVELEARLKSIRQDLEEKRQASVLP